MAEIETDRSAYWDAAECKFFLPDTLIAVCVRGGAAATKKGRDIDRAVIVSEPQVFIETTVHKTLEAYFADPAFRLEGPCKIPPKTGSLIWKCRCMIPSGWKITFTLEYDQEIVAEQSLKNALVTAGRLVGIGGWRPKFGRFTVEFN